MLHPWVSCQSAGYGIPGFHLAAVHSTVSGNRLNSEKDAMKKAVFFVLLLVAAYVAGYWPQRGLKNDLAAAKSVTHACRLQDELMDILDQVQSQNYGTGQQIAGQFFNDLHNQIDDPAYASYRQNLQAILDRRDAVISALAKADGSIAGPLRQDLAQIHQMQEKLASQSNL
jgi:hypothetical protein